MLYNDGVLYNSSVLYNGPDIVFFPSGAGGRQTGPFRFPTVVRLRPEVLDEMETRRRLRSRILEEDDELLTILD